MPIYTYKCDACDQYFEQKQRMSDEPLRDCILCENGRVRRVINSVGIVFKGNGFYVTDTRKANGNSASNGKSETKPAAKEKESKNGNTGTADTPAASASKETSKTAAATT